MSQNFTALVDELKNLSIKFGAPVEVEVMRSFLADGKSPEEVRFLLRFRYPLKLIEALAAEIQARASA